MKGLDAYHDRLQADQERRDEEAAARAEAREAAVEEMVAELAAGRDVIYGQRVVNRPEGGVRVANELLTADDVRDELDADALRSAMVNGEACYPMWLEAARRVCARHADEYLEWRATV